MTPRLVLLGVLLFPPRSNAQSALPGPIVTVEWLAANAKAGSLVILHADRTRQAYDSAHVPGARFVPLDAYAPPRDGIAAELPSPDSVAHLLESLGVSNASQVVIYGDILAAARLWFTLDWLGDGDRAAVLDGGMDAWRSAAQPVSVKPPRISRGRFAPSHRPEVAVDADWLRDRLGRPALLLLDGRSPEEFRGERAEEGVPRGGHIPGAVSFDWRSTVEGGRFLPLSRLRELFAGAGARTGGEMVTYCRTGMRSSVLYLAARALGYSPKMYDGSMVDWSRRAELPVER